MSVEHPVTILEQALRAPVRPSSDYDLNNDVDLSENRRLRAAAVLIPIDCDGSEAHVLLTKRASGLKHHPGQIAFPGGKQDEGDPTPEAAALREAHEEVGLHPDNVRILGRLPTHETVTGYQVTPILGHICAPFTARREPGEVEEIFSVPLSHVMDKSNFLIEGRYWQGRLRRYYTVPYGPYYIWGATARMLWTLADAGSA